MVLARYSTPVTTLENHAHLIHIHIYIYTCIYLYYIVYLSAFCFITQYTFLHCNELSSSMSPALSTCLLSSSLSFDSFTCNTKNLKKNHCIMQINDSMSKFHSKQSFLFVLYDKYTAEKFVCSRPRTLYTVCHLICLYSAGKQHISTVPKCSNDRRIN